MYEGVPSTLSAAVSTVLSIVLAMPKSITRGPSVAISTLAGFRSRCTSPLLWMARSASARPAISRHTAGSGSGPAPITMSCSGGPGTNAVASHGGSSSGPAATTGLAYAPLTACAAATSRRNRLLNSGSWARCGYTTFTATARPDGDTPRYTRPMPPDPSRARSRNSPIARGSSAASGIISAPYSPSSARTVPVWRLRPPRAVK